jgi:hypothetical protein
LAKNLGFQCFLYKLRRLGKALARRRAIIMHAMLRNETEFAPA